MKSKTLNIVVVAIGVLGFLGLVVYKKKKKNAIITPKVPGKTEIVNNTFHKEPQLSEMNSGNFTIPGDWIEAILRKQVKEYDFSSCEELLYKIVIECNLHCEIDEWMERVPTTIEDVETLLKENGLYEEFVAKMYNSYRKKK